MLRAPDGHAKNFSLSIRPRGSYRLTPLYDLMSTWPLIGEGPGLLSEHKVRLAMAVRSTNAHWKMKEIRRRHWLALGKRFGVLDADGQGMETILEKLIAQTPDVVARIEASLPKGFPAAVADPVLRGLERAAQQLAVE